MSMDKLIMDDYKRRIGFPNTSFHSSVRAIAQKFGVSESKVKQSIAALSPKDSADAVSYKIRAGRYKNMRKVVVKIRNEEVTWHTTASDEEIEGKIKKLKERMSSDV